MLQASQNTKSLPRTPVSMLQMPELGSKRASSANIASSRTRAPRSKPRTLHQAADTPSERNTGSAARPSSRSRQTTSFSDCLWKTGRYSSCVVQLELQGSSYAQVRARTGFEGQENDGPRSKERLCRPMWSCQNDRLQNFKVRKIEANPHQVQEE